METHHMMGIHHVENSDRNKSTFRFLNILFHSKVYCSSVHEIRVRRRKNSGQQDLSCKTFRIMRVNCDNQLSMGMQSDIDCIILPSLCCLFSSVPLNWLDQGWHHHTWYIYEICLFCLIPNVSLICICIYICVQIFENWVIMNLSQLHFI